MKMRDRLGREMDYLRLSVTDRCQLRCRYCMPESGVEHLPHGEILRYEDMLRIARVMAELGVKKVRVTGGEPLARRGLPVLIAGLKALPGMETVALTTNGMELADALAELVRAGLDAVNISLDTVDEGIFEAVTRRKGVGKAIDGVRAALSTPRLRVKLNCVPTELNAAGIGGLARFAAKNAVPLRFIELMPMGCGTAVRGLSEAETMAVLKNELGEPAPGAKTEKDGKCRYYTFPGGAEIGFISPVSRPFCAGCDRIRLTAEGVLKTCLQCDSGTALRPLLAGSDEEIRRAIEEAVLAKPAGHHFGLRKTDGDDSRAMWQIGG